jgi:hypothetical protein
MRLTADIARIVGRVPITAKQFRVVAVNPRLALRQ